MTLIEFLTTLDADPNWRKHETTNFKLYARRDILELGRSDRPLPGLKPKAGCWEVFQALREEWWAGAIELVTAVDQNEFGGQHLAKRQSLKKVPIVIWDTNYVWPIEAHEGALSYARRRGTTARELSDPITIPNDNPTATGPESDYVIVIPLPRAHYWGEARRHWLCGAVAHEMFHVWSSWSGPGAVLTYHEANPWQVFDEASAVWAEKQWVAGGPTYLDYAIPWFHQSGVSLYGGGCDSGVSAKLNYSMGYNQFAFLAWLHTQDKDAIRNTWLESQITPLEMDPWRCLDKVIQRRPDGENLTKWYSRFAAEAYTCDFRKSHFPTAHEQWYLKAVEEVFELNPSRPFTPLTRYLLPLSKRAFLLRMDGGKKYAARLTQMEPGFALHVVEEDGNGVWKAVLKSSDTTAPYEVEIPAAKFAILIVSYGQLAPPANPSTQPVTKLSPVKFDLSIS